MSDAQKIYALILAILVAGSGQQEINNAVLQRADQIMHIATKGHNA